MKGTEKQVKWAEDIIEGAKNALDRMERNVIRFAENGMAEDTLGYDINDVNTVRAWAIPQIEVIENATTIINFRDRLTQKAFEQMAQMHHKEGK